MEDRSNKSLEAAGTALLRQHGYRADGTPLDEKRQEIRYGLLSPTRIASLRAVEGVGGQVHLCHYGNRIKNPAADYDDNSLSLVERSLEEID